MGHLGCFNQSKLFAAKINYGLLHGTLFLSDGEIYYLSSQLIGGHVLWL